MRRVRVRGNHSSRAVGAAAAVRARAVAVLSAIAVAGLLLCGGAASAATDTLDAEPVHESTRVALSDGERLLLSAEMHAGRPYVWGSAGLKSFDCSGYVWRVLADNGVLIKRTTARKLSMCLPHVPDSLAYAPGNLVFFDNLKHCGLVADDSTFYHAQLTKGTNRSLFAPFWKPKICCVRRYPELPAP